MLAHINSYNEVIYRGRNCGFIENGIYKTPREPDSFMRKFGGFGISEGILTLLERNKITRILFLYKGKKGAVVWESTVNDFRRTPNVHYDGKDRQKFMPTYLMKKQIVSNVI